MSAQVVVLGAAVAGTTLATLLAREGVDVLLVDQHPEPQVAVGESLLPFGSRVLQKLGVPMDGFRVKHGAVFTRGGRSVRFPFAESARPTWTSAWQVTRADFDGRLRQVAADAGVRFLNARVLDLDVEATGGPTASTDAGVLRAERIVDACGRRKLLAHKLGLVRHHPVLRNAALAAHCRGVRCLAPEEEGDIAVCAFDGGWWWFIPFANGVTSVGVVTTPSCPLTGDRWAGALEACPDAARRLKGAVRLHAPRGLQDFTSYAARFWGPGWALCGDAALFLDPVFSSGVLLALEGADGLAQALLAGTSEAMESWEAGLRRAAAPLEAAILAFYDGSFLDVAFVPEHIQKPQYRAGIISLLAGDVFGSGNPWPQAMAEKLPVLADMARRLGP